MFDGQRVGAIIVAAGSGRRMAGQDKVFGLLAGRPILARTMAVFEASPSIDSVVIVLSRQNLGRGHDLASREGWAKVLSICAGGARRQDSVRCGLAHLDDCDWIVIHDGARPLLSPALIDRALEMAAKTGAAVPGLPVADTIKQADSGGLIEATVDRAGLWAVQTPQVFRDDIIRAAYTASDTDVTDDAQLVELNGGRVRLFAGEPANIKITTPDDLAVAEVILCKGGVL